MAYPNLKKEMNNRGIKVQDIATEIEVHRNSIFNKVNYNTRFYVDEAIKVHYAFFKDMDFGYLFQQKSYTDRESE